MRVTSNRSRRFLALLLVLALGASACVRITVEADPVPRAAVVEAGTEKIEGPDAAVIAIDFDPPLRTDGLLSADQATLLVAVENRGSTAAEQVAVEARLFGVEQSDLLLLRTTTIERIVPGESRVVRFSGLPPVPLLSAYVLRINIPPVSGEQATGNNQRTFSLRIDTAP